MGRDQVIIGGDDGNIGDAVLQQGVPAVSGASGKIVGKIGQRQLLAERPGGPGLFNVEQVGFPAFSASLNYTVCNVCYSVMHDFYGAQYTVSGVCCWRRI